MTDKINTGPFHFENGMTVAELKEIIKDWPETDNKEEPTEVWLGSGDGLSNVAVELWELNDYDILIEHRRITSNTGE